MHKTIEMERNCEALNFLISPHIYDDMYVMCYISKYQLPVVNLTNERTDGQIHNHNVAPAY